MASMCVQQCMPKQPKHSNSLNTTVTGYRYTESTILLRPGHSKNIFQDKKILKFHGHSSGHKTTQTRLKSAIKVI